jgi:phosphatidyl-myo-inositol dimannoside synthase
MVAAPSLRVRFISRKWKPAMGGMETYSVRLAEELTKRCRLETDVLPGRLSGKPPGAVRLLLFGIGSALRLLIARRPDVVHIGDLASWPLGWIASLRHPASRIVLSAHGSDVGYAKRQSVRARLYGAYLRAGSRLLGGALLIANSRWIARLAEEQGFRRTVVIVLGTDVAPRPAPTRNNGCLFFAGRIARRKGLSFFIREVLPLIPDPPKIRVAGAVIDAGEAAILGSTPVEYLGVLDSEALAREYAEALCVIVPSLEPEGFGLVAAEAAVAGGVVLASAHSGLLEAVDEDTGFTADPADPGRWAEIIGRVRGWRPDERDRFVAAAQAKSGAKFSWSRVADETLNAYTLRF